MAGLEEARRRIAELLSGSGGARALLLVGAAGTGKTTLLRWAEARTADRPVLRVAGLEVEAALDYAGLDLLLRGLPQQPCDLPDHHRRALETALGQTPAPRRSADALAVAAAVEDILTSAGTGALVMADDLQWLDGCSRAVLGLLARRLKPGGPLLLLSTRPPVDPEVVGLDRVEVEGLERAAALLLLQGSFGCSVEVAERLVEMVDGNPQGLVEVAGALTSEEREGRALLPDPLPVGGRVADSGRRVLEPLDAMGRGALLIAAAAGRARLAEVLDAIAAAGLERSALTAAESLGLVRLEPAGVAFATPLLRSAIYHGAAAAERRQAHAALAAAARDPARRVLHRASATVEPDEALAGELEAVGIDAGDHLGPLEAAAALERAAALSPTDDERARRLILAAQSHCLAARSSHALELLDQAMVLSRDSPELRGAAQSLRGSLLLWRGRPGDAAGLLEHEAELLRSSAPSVAVRLLCEAVSARLVTGDLGIALALTARARDIAGRHPEADAQLPRLQEALLELLLARRGLGDLPESEQLARAASSDGAAHLAAQIYAVALVYGEELDRARSLLSILIDTARARGAPWALPLPLALRAELELRAGAWSIALRAATESVELARSTRQRSQEAMSLATLGRVKALRGDAEARDLLAAARGLGDECGLGTITTMVAASEGVAHLAEGRLDEALDALLEARAHAQRQRLHHPTVVSWAADLVEAAVALGHADLAAEVTEDLSRAAADTESIAGAALAARCRGLVSGPDRSTQALTEAIALHQRAGAPYEEARTRLNLGLRLRRARDLQGARRELRLARSAFQRLGARPWVARAESELRAAGARLAKAPATGVLTAQELLVALRAAEGATNREVAAALFISPKTVENHLSRVYAKLGIRGRVQLAAAIGSVTGSSDH